MCYFLFTIEYCHCGSGVLDVLPIIPDNLCNLLLVLKEFKYFQQMITDLHMLPTVNLVHMCESTCCLFSV